MKNHLYADDTIINLHTSSQVQATGELKADV